MLQATNDIKTQTPQPTLLPTPRRAFGSPPLAPAGKSCSSPLRPLTMIGSQYMTLTYGKTRRRQWTVGTPKGRKSCVTFQQAPGRAGAPTLTNSRMRCLAISLGSGRGVRMSSDGWTSGLTSSALRCELVSPRRRRRGVTPWTRTTWTSTTTTTGFR